MSHFQNPLRTTFKARDLAEPAPSLINSVSGLANDYLNQFNEVVMLIEQLPAMPDLIDDLLAWRPLSYDTYFTHSSLPGRDQARAAYAKLDVQFKKQFEEVVDELDRITTGSVVAIRRQVRVSSGNQPENLSALCEKAGFTLRRVLQKATSIVNNGLAERDENAQRRADRLLAFRIQAMREAEGLVNGPQYVQG